MLGCITGSFYRLFYPPKAETEVFVLDRDKLNFLIKNRAFDSELSVEMKTCKDIFVFGCSVGLRFSDLKALRQKNIEINGDSRYVVNISKKTNKFKSHTQKKKPAVSREPFL